MYLLVVKYIYYRHQSQTPDMENAEAIMVSLEYEIIQCAEKCDISKKICSI